MTASVVNFAAVTAPGLQAEAESLAKNAEDQYKKVESFKPRFKQLAREQLDAAIEAGKHLCKAKALLDHGNFNREFKRWEINRTITFSPRTGRRYMLLATYAEAGTLANVANLTEAERIVTALSKREKSTPASRGEGSQRDDSTTPPDASATSASELETRILKTMRRFAGIDQRRTFLTDLITKLNHRLSLLDA